MKKYIKKINLILCLVVIFATSCVEETVLKFDDQDSLYFFRGSNNYIGETQIDSVVFSFFFEPLFVERDTAWLDIRLTGMPSGVPRPIPVSQINAGSPGAAVAGTHYICFTDPQFAQHLILPAGGHGIMLPVVLLRHVDMRTEEFRLEIGIGTSQFFVEGITGQTVFLLKINDFASKPPNWDLPHTLLETFGSWGARKMWFLYNHVGFRDFWSGDRILPDMQNYWRHLAQTRLAEFEAIHGPLYEDDGTRVTF